MKKLLALLLALVMLLSLAQFASAEEPVKLVWWLGCTSQAPVDWAEVEAKLNEISQKEIGVTCEFKYKTSEQITLDTQSGEYFDIAFTCGWYNDFATNVADGMFLDLTDLINVNAPELIASMPENVWAGSYVNGKLYAVPHMKDYAMEIFWILDTEYFVREKGLRPDPYISFEDMGDYMAMYKKDYPDKYPLMISKGGVTSWMNCLADWISMEYLIGLDWEKIGTEDALTVKSAFEIPAFINRLNVIHEWYNLGYINPDAAVTESMGRSVAGVVQSGQGWFGAETIWSNARQKESYIARYDGTYMNTDSLRGSMTAVSSMTKYPEAALKLINLMNTNEEYRTLARYGIEGKHYEKVSEGIVKKTELGMKNMSLWAYTQGSYIVGPNEASAFDAVPTDPDMWKKVWAGYDRAIISPALGFTLDQTDIQEQCLAMAAVWADYKNELITGTSDPAVVVPEIIEKLEQAGLRDVLKNIQAQLDAYMAKK